MAETGQACILSDTHTYPLWIDLPETHWVRSYLGAPILVSGEIIGFVNVTSAQPGFFTEQHVGRLQAFADQAAIAINNAHTYDDLERRVIERTVDLSLRNAVAETLSNTLDMDQMLSGVLRTTVERLGVLGGAIYLLADDETTLSLAASYGVAADTLQLVTGIVPGGVNLGLIGDAPYVLNGALPDIPHATGISAVLSVPIWQHGQMLGVITLVHDQPRPWRTEETRMLDAIGRQIGVALVNARLYADAVRSEARIRTILQSAADGLLVFDRDNHLVLMNQAAESLVSFYPSEAGGARQAAALPGNGCGRRRCIDDPGAVEFSLPTMACSRWTGQSMKTMLCTTRTAASARSALAVLVQPKGLVEPRCATVPSTNASHAAPSSSQRHGAGCGWGHAGHRDRPARCHLLPRVGRVERAVCLDGFARAAHAAVGGAAPDQHPAQIL
jgi:GAF domain-containing protein